MNVEWDEQKNRTNQARHHISFENVRELFISGRDYLDLYDAAHSNMEDRFIAIGLVKKGLVVVVFTEQDEDAIRIISARFATAREQRLYEEYMEHRHE